MSLKAQVKGILDATTGEVNGPVGIVFGAVDKHGKLLVAEASGKTALNGDDPMTVDSYFPLFSTTKNLVGIAAMQLVEQGKLKLDEPIDTILPELTAPQILTDDLTLRPATKKITLRMLLSHTAGFGYTFFNHKLAKWFEKQNTGIDEFSGTIEGFGSPLLFEPGEGWEYGINLDWAGEAVARVSGKTLGEYCAEHIFKPLGLKDISFDVSPQNRSRLVAMHQRHADGTITQRDHLPFVHKSTFDSGGAGAFGTLHDYLQILVALLNGGTGANGAQILKPETVKEMFIDQIGYLPGRPMDVTIPSARDGYTYDVVGDPSIRKGWGLTFQLNLDPLPTGRSANSANWAGLANLYYSVDPTKGIATMVMSQSLPFFDMKVILPWLTAEKIVYDSL